jgi:hypothetical protein
MFRSAPALSALLALVLLTGGCSKHYSYPPGDGDAAATDRPTAPAVPSSATHLVRYVVTGNSLATTLLYADPLKDTAVTAPPTALPWSTTLPMVVRPGAYVALSVSVATSQVSPTIMPSFTCQIWVDGTMVAHDSGILAFCNDMWNEKAG